MTSPHGQKTSELFSSIKAEMNLTPEDGDLREKNMENMKHAEMRVPGVSFYSAGGIGKQYQRHTLQ